MYKIHIFHNLLGSNKQTVGDGEKLLTHLNSALNVLLGLDIFPREPKKMLNFVDQCNWCICWFSTHMLTKNTVQGAKSPVKKISLGSVARKDLIPSFKG